MQRGHFYFVTGGARSGKSAFAEKLAASSKLPVTYLATAEALDKEMADRIRRHQERRPADWKTVEEPRSVPEVLKKIGDRDGFILIDCLTLLVTNLLFSPEFAEEILEAKQDRVLSEMHKLAAVAHDSRSEVVLVSNEVGLGIVPDNPETRLFRDVAGWANQIMASQADHVYFLISGLALDLKDMQRQTGPEI
jgi:adenosylcobinamide kinase/adenosylcobinamide-phosphate guanylyltransferase